MKSMEEMFDLGFFYLPSELQHVNCEDVICSTDCPMIGSPELTYAGYTPCAATLLIYMSKHHPEKVLEVLL